jgi:hypothetical protein
MTVLEVLFEPTQRHTLEIRTNEGTFYLPRQKALFLQQGYVFVFGEDVTDGRITTTTGVVPSDVYDGRPYPGEAEGVVDDPIVVEIAHRHALGEYEDQATPGPLPIPTFEEADGAHYTYDPAIVRLADPKL